MGGDVSPVSTVKSYKVRIGVGTGSQLLNRLTLYSVEISVAKISRLLFLGLMGVSLVDDFVEDSE